jgi:hypothetical protein
MSAIVKTEAVQPRQIELPQFSYGPFILFEALPWLLIATVLRFVAFDKGSLIQVPFMILESFAIFLAFLLAARRMVEITDSQTRLGYLSFAKQLNLARDIVCRIFLLLFAVAFAAFVVGAHKTAPYLLLGLDGIAFDQASRVGMIWSSALAAIVFLMVLNAEKSNPSTVTNALGELARRAVWMVPAIIAVALLQIGLNYIQSLVRGLIFLLVQTSASQEIKNFVFFFFVFGFASIRLWATLAILALALRESYRRSKN